MGDRALLGLVLLLFAQGVACNAILGITGVPIPLEGGLDAEAIEAGADSTGAPTVDPGDAGNSGEAAPPSDAGSPGSDVVEPCSDTQSDPNNCGHCGHSCQGGACVSASCQPVLLYPPADAGSGVQPWDFAQDTTSLYWVDLTNHAINQTDKTSGQTTSVLSNTATPRPTAIAVDSVAVYWSDAVGILRCGKSGCSDNPALVTASGGAAQSVAVDDTYLYWSDGTQQMASVHKLGTNEGANVLYSSGTNAPSYVVSDGQFAYFTAADSALRSVAIDGGPGFALPSTITGGSNGVTLAQGVVYWTITNASAGQVLGSPTATPGASPIAVMQPSPLFVASDGTNIYWTTGQNLAGQVASCAIVNCRPAQLTGVGQPTKILVDDTAIYWIDSASVGDNFGSIYKLAK